MAANAQRNGQGNALRTAMRGALMVKRRRRSLKRIPTGTADALKSSGSTIQPRKKPQQEDLRGFLYRL
jgi:hypothetical protein